MSLSPRAIVSTCGVVIGLLVPAIRAEQLFIAVEDPAPRKANCAPARVSIDFREILDDASARIDPRSLRLFAMDAQGNASAESLPVRFDDPDPKPDSFFHAYIGGGGVAGDLVFQHRSSGARTSRYKLSFERWKQPDRIVPASPAAQIGDYDILRYDTGPLSGMFHTKIAVADWDGDRRLDLIAGDGLGMVAIYRGLPGEPLSFDTPRFLEADGKPIDVGYTAAPDVVDWDGDGDLDLICGEESKGGILFFENTGSRTKPVLRAGKPIATSDGNAIISPHAPVPEMSFFKKDYSPSPRVVDYNGDGRLDLVSGGYVTGLMFYFENVNSEAKGPPRLESRGPLKLESGETLDVSWCASPEFADLDGDGDLDLVSGHIAERKDRFGWRESPSVLFYENVGSRTEPKWRAARMPMPEHWTPYPPDVTIPRLIDWDGDGDLDLLMSARCEVFAFENVGTARAARFEFRAQLQMSAGPLLVNYAVNAVAPCLGDLNGDGLPDLLRGGSGNIPLALMTSKGHAPRFKDVGPLEVDGKPIYKPFIHGDDTSFPFLFDWDADGDLDLLLGDGEGYVWLFRNQGDRRQWRFVEGVKLKLESGEDLIAGPPTPPDAKDFEQHSGNRNVPAPGDYDGDGMVDLICSNAEGRVYFYKGAKGDRFAPGVEIASGTNRCFTYPVDWDDDGKLDVVLAWGGNPQSIYLNRGADPAKAAPRFEVLPIRNMPWIPYPRPMAVDWDGDGDVDLLYASSYSLVHFVSRDFLEHGYLKAQVVEWGEKK